MKHVGKALPTLCLSVLLLASASASRIEVDPNHEKVYGSAEAASGAGGASLSAAGDEPAPLTRGSADRAQRNRRLLQLGKPK